MIVDMFPPLEDEHVFSWLARLHALGSLPTVSKTLERFGITSGRLDLDYTYSPCMSQLFKFLHNCRWDIDELLQHNTLMSWHSITVPSDVKNLLTGYLLGGDIQTKFHPNDRSMFDCRLTPKACPDCIEEDTARYGISYWHVTHQLTSVFLCEKHGTMLVEPVDDISNLNKLQMPLHFDLWRNVVSDSTTNMLSWNQFIIDWFNWSKAGNTIFSPEFYEGSPDEVIDLLPNDELISLADRTKERFEKVVGKDLLHYLYGYDCKPLIFYRSC